MSLFSSRALRAFYFSQDLTSATREEIPRCARSDIFRHRSTCLAPYQAGAVERDHHRGQDDRRVLDDSVRTDWHLTSTAERTHYGSFGVERSVRRTVIDASENAA